MKLKLLTLSLILLLGGALQTIPAQGGMPPYESAHNLGRHNQVGSGDNIAFWPLLSADRPAGIAEENRIPNLMRIDRIDDMQSCGICHEYRRGYLPRDIFAGWRGYDRNFPESNTFKFWTSLCLKAVHHRAADTCLPKWICSKIQDIGHSMARVEADSRNLTFLRLGGVLQSETERRPGHEPANNPAVGLDPRAAQISDHRCPAEGDPALLFCQPWDSSHGCTGYDKARSLSSRPTGIGGSVTAVTLSDQCSQSYNSSFYIRRFRRATLFDSGIVRRIPDIEMVVRRLEPLEEDYLTSSKLGGVLYYSHGRRWLPDEHSREAHQRAAEIHDDRRPCIPRDCTRPECMFGTGILSSTRTVYSKYSDRDIFLRDCYCQADCNVSYARVCPPQQIINCHKIPNSEQSIYSRLFYALADLGMGLIPRKEVRHV